MNEDIKEILNNFLKQAKTDSLKTSHYPHNYSNLKLRVSFGQGTPTKIPWISFLGEGQKTSKGIYPVFLYYNYDELEKLILAYGISETNEPSISWNLPKNTQTIEEYFISSLNTKPFKYGDSYVYAIYDTNAQLDWNQIEKDLSNLIKEYKEVLKSGDLVKENNTEQL